MDKRERLSPGRTFLLTSLLFLLVSHSPDGLSWGADHLEFTSCHTITADTSAAVPAGFGVPYNVVSPGQESLLTAQCEVPPPPQAQIPENPSNPFTHAALNAMPWTPGNGVPPVPPKPEVQFHLGSPESPLTYSYLLGYAYVPVSPKSAVYGHPPRYRWEAMTYQCQGETINAIWCHGQATASRTGAPKWFTGYTCTWTPAADSTDSRQAASGQDGQWKCGCRDTACRTSYWQIQGITPPLPPQPPGSPDGNSG